MTMAQKIFKSFLWKNAQKRRIFFNLTVLFVLIVVMGVYLWQVNTGVNQCLKIEVMKEKLEALEKENEELMKKVSNLGSIANVYEVAQKLEMVKLDQVDYVFSSQEALAEK